MYEPIGTRTARWAERIIMPLRLRAKRQERDRGEPLDAVTRLELEQLLGFDLAQVRLHKGERAETAARKLDARAFTVGGQVFGSRHELDTAKVVGLGLLAHELTHVVQQTQPAQVPRAVPGWVASQTSGGGNGLVLLAPVAPPAANPDGREAQAEINERIMVEAVREKPETSPSIDAEEIAAIVYKLMQYDLVLERERGGTPGGQRW